ncbi:MAG: HAMP domain-containing histidine kinase [Candidatus Hydrogenedentes bacterium]|nr:HAMP domain-containing histidine kinase [Candidatus Hydrogenedentota bacterium]
MNDHARDSGAEPLSWLESASQGDMLRAVEALYRVHTLLGALSDLDALLEKIGQECRNLAGAEAASVMLYDERNDELYFRVAMGDSGDQERLKKLVRLRRGQGLAWAAADSRQSVVSRNAQADPRFFSVADTITAFQTRNVLAVPMLDGGRLVGVLEVINKQNGAAFTPLDVHVIEMFSSVAATAVVNARLIERQIETERLAAIGKAIAGLAHHIKNIVTGLSSSSELIGMALEQRNLDLAAQSWPVLRRSVQRVASLVQDLLTFSKERAPVRRPCDPAALVRDVCDTTRDLLTGRNIRISHDVERCQGLILADMDSLYQCLLNLVQNAADAVTPGEGDVVVTAMTRDDGMAVFEVSDNGPGVPDAVLPHLFEPFFSTKGGAGTGLGLATTAKIVREHGGEIELVRQSPGACFRITIPSMASGKPEGPAEENAP